jgi:hypothetical protein
MSKSTSTKGKRNTLAPLIWFIRLAHVDNAYMIETVEATGESFLEKLPECHQSIEENGRFYYRVMVPIEIRLGPDLLSPVISRTLIKNAEEIIECSQILRFPESHIVFCKLAYEEGWLFETLNSGIKVLERLENEPQIENGHFFYLVLIPVGLRVVPHIMAQRVGKGFKLHSIVEGSQRFTPPGSKITYVKVSNEKGWIFETTMDGQVVLQRIEKPLQRQVERLFYRLLQDVEVLNTPFFSETIGSINSSSNGSSNDSSSSCRSTNGSSSSSSCSSSNRNTTAIATIATETNLEAIEEEQTKRMGCRRRRLKDSLIECSERLVPYGTNIGYLKLRHDAGWICERLNTTIDDTYSSNPLVVEQVQGYAVTRDTPKFYRVLLTVAVRSAPDFYCTRLPGVAPKTVGTIFESCLQYTPPGSRVTYVKLSNENGWVFEQTPQGNQVLEALNEDPHKKQGKFYYRVLKKVPVLLSPELTSEITQYLFEGTIFCAELEYSLPGNQQKYVLLTKEKGWIALDYCTQMEEEKEDDSISRGHGHGHGHGRWNETTTNTLISPRYPYPNTQSHPNSQSHQNVQQVSEELYNLYTMPPSWVSIGYPNRSWFKVPDEENRHVLAEEMWFQANIFKQRKILAASSQGKENVPIIRKGILHLDTLELMITMEEIKHPASALMFTFPWKQIWWNFEIDGVKHSVELQHGLRGGFRSIYFDGLLIHQNRSVTDFLWDNGSEFEFTWENHKIKTIISLEGAFFSQYLQFYGYFLIVDEQEIVPLDL